MNYSLKGIGGIFLALALALTGVAGCSDSGVDAVEPGGGDSDDGEATEDSGLTISEAGMSAMNARALAITFASPMQTDTVDVSIFMPAEAEATVATEKAVDSPPQDAVRIKRQFWSADRRTLTMIGPYPYCTTFTIEVAPGAKDDEGLELGRILKHEFVTGPNPGNFSRNTACQSDLLLYPAFSDSTDLLIMTGVQALEGGNFEQADVDTAEFWYFNASKHCGTPAQDTGCFLGMGSDVQLLPGIAADGGPVLAMVGASEGGARLFSLSDPVPIEGLLFAEGPAPSTSERLLRWSGFAPAAEAPGSVHEVAQAPRSMLRDIVGVADGNGDAVNDILLGWAQSLTGEDLLWQLRSIDAMADAGAGQDLLEETVAGAAYGREGFESRLSFLENLDGDGAKALVELRQRQIDIGNGDLRSGDAQIRIHHQGRIDLVEEEDLQRQVLSLAAADVNGDGAADLVVLDALHQIAEEDLNGDGELNDLQRVDNRIRILFGGAFTGGIRSLADADVEILKATVWDGDNLENLEDVKNVGDLNADGYADLAIGFRATDPIQPEYRAVFIVYGRGDWAEMDDLDRDADLLIEGAQPSTGERNLRVDVDNDGYDDLVLRDMSSKETFSTFIFRGGPGLTGDTLGVAAADGIIKLVQMVR